MLTMKTRRTVPGHMVIKVFSTNLKKIALLTRVNWRLQHAYQSSFKSLIAVPTKIQIINTQNEKFGYVKFLLCTANVFILSLSSETKCFISAK